jgi:gas vesicle protein
MRDSEYDDDGEPYIIIEKTSGGMSSFLMGLAVGAGLALLFAPQSGAETRQSIRRNARKMRHAAEDAVGDVTQKVGDTFETAKQRVEERIEEARGAIETKREQVARAVQAGRDAAQQARSDLERRLAETKAAYQAGAQVARESKGKNT